jgi:putative membrane protein
MLRLLLVWILNAVALYLVTLILPGVKVAQWWPDALIAVLVLGLVNAVIKPVLVLLTLPATIVTLGLFLLVINGLLFWAVGSLLRGFQVEGFWWAVGGALLYSLFSWAFASVLQKDR